IFICIFDKNKWMCLPNFYGCSMRYVPWSKMMDWFCVACGSCCKEFKVPLRAYETTLLSNLFGYRCMEPDVGTFYLRRRENGRCIFQIYNDGKFVCGIQALKPLACKMWPFLVCEKPEYEFKEEALFEFRGERFYIYVHPKCRGLKYGPPTSNLIKKTIPEFIEIKLGLRRSQSRSTSLLVKLPCTIHKSTSLPMPEGRHRSLNPKIDFTFSAFSKYLRRTIVIRKEIPAWWYNESHGSEGTPPHRGFASIPGGEADTQPKRQGASFGDFYLWHLSHRA
ncbi:MAG: YkgJ family cysteine cluster protein, partial [Candidatus Methanomethylicaceae archaeon]